MRLELPPAVIFLASTGVLGARQRHKDPARDD
jgi:hypothetical protein